MRKLVIGFIAFVFVCILLYWLLVGVLLVKVADKVDKQGLKGVVERVWNGSGK